MGAAAAVSLALDSLIATHSVKFFEEIRAAGLAKGKAEPEATAARREERQAIGKQLRNEELAKRHCSG